ncbi:MAG: late competence development ComFB family protein [Leptolyngbya sp. SIOISBB]|nr:late competence development ComFB family protein [Leptolyngbya sp. SIOISBB]
MVSLTQVTVCSGVYYRVMLMAPAFFTQDNTAYVNVMEGLVAQETWRQLKDMPRWFRRSRRWAEIMPYALNRLPTLYASSQRGWQHHLKFAQRELKDTIRQVVKDALLITRPDPLEHREPLKLERLNDSEVVLQALSSVFQLPELDWVTALEQLQALKQDATAFTTLCEQSTPAWKGSGHVSPWHQRYSATQTSEPLPSDHL